MATIKDVAKRAGVSLGTVSNVLNGKTKNEDLISRVERAMEELSYRPDAVARSLKSTQSKLVGVILPSSQEKVYSDFLLEAERRLREKGYSVLVKFSRNNRLVERKCMEACLQQCVAGVILFSNIHEKPDIHLYNSTIPQVLITKSDIPGYRGDQILISYQDAFDEAMRDFAHFGITRVGLIMEKEMIQNKSLLKSYHSFYSNSDLIKLVESRQEEGYQAFFELYTANPGIQAVIVGSHLIGTGAKKAMETLGNAEIPVVAMKESSWIEDAGYYEAQLSVSLTGVAKAAVQRLIDAITKPNLHEQVTDLITAKYDKIPRVETGIHKASADLLFAMYDCSSAKSLQMLSRIYEKKSGKKVTFDLYSYRELEELLYSNAQNQDAHYDGFMMDVTWLEGLVENGGVENLDGFWNSSRDYFEGFIEGVVKEYGMYVESLYAIPFMSGAQILFYQKDLFEDRGLQLHFRRICGEELLPPKTWAQYNLVAEFFTRSYQEQSPVKYGLSLQSGANVYTAIGFLSRLWAYNSRIFDEKGNVILENGNSVMALKNFAASYQYSSGRDLHSWNEVAEEFAEGNSAMTILYDSDAGSINNYNRSKVAGNLGYSLIPGGNPVLGGWSLGLNRFGKSKEAALDFLMWACGNQNSIPLSLLGGSTLRQEYYARADLENMQPWKHLILKSHNQSRKRTMPEILEESRWKNNLYTKIIPEEITKVLQKQIDEEEAIYNMQVKIQQMIL